jgi:hypothetical protein
VKTILMIRNYLLSNLLYDMSLEMYKKDSGQIEIQQDISTSGQACLCYITGQKHEYYKQNKETVLLAIKYIGLEAGTKKSKNRYAHSLSPNRYVRSCSATRMHPNFTRQ